MPILTTFGGINKTCLKATITSIGLALSACGSSSITSDSDLTDFDRISASALSIRTAYPDAARTEVAQVPTAGSADYAGFMSITLANHNDNIPDAMAGEMNVSIDFSRPDKDMLSGLANSFVDQAGNQIAGQLVLSGGTMVRGDNPTSSPRFGFQGSGDLTDASSQTINIEATFSGDFFGQNSDALGGVVAGSATALTQSQLLEGSFIVVKTTGGTQ